MTTLQTEFAEQKNQALDFSKVQIVPAPSVCPLFVGAHVKSSGGALAKGIEEIQKRRQEVKLEEVSEGKRNIYEGLTVASVAGVVGALDDPGALATLMANVFRNYMNSERLQTNSKKRWVQNAFGKVSGFVKRNKSHAPPAMQADFNESELYRRDRQNNLLAAGFSTPLASSYLMYAFLGVGSAAAAIPLTAAGVCMVSCYLLRASKCRMDMGYAKQIEGIFSKDSQGKMLAEELRESVAVNNAFFKGQKIEGTESPKFAGFWDKTGHFFKKTGYNMTRYMPSFLMGGRSVAFGTVGAGFGLTSLTDLAGGIVATGANIPMMLSATLFFGISCLTWKSDTGHNLLARLEKYTETMKNKTSHDESETEKISEEGAVVKQPCLSVGV